MTYYISYPIKSLPTEADADDVTIAKTFLGDTA